MTELRALVRDHAAATAEIEQGVEDVTDEALAKQAQLYAKLIEHPSDSVEDVILKLRAMCAHHAGGYVPVDDLARVTGELERVAT